MTKKEELLQAKEKELAKVQQQFEQQVNFHSICVYESLGQVDQVYIAS